MSNTRNIPATLHFGAVPLTPVFHDGQPYLTAADVARALGYSRTDKVSQLYQRNITEFTPEMSLTLKMRANGFGNGGAEKDVRIFSARGCHLIAMFAQTQRAADFRRWVLDVLEQHQQHAPPSPAQAVYQLSPAELMEYIGHALAKAGLGAAPSDAVPARELVETQRQLIDAQRQLLASKPHGRKAGAQAGKPVSPGEAAHMRRLRAEGLTVREVAQRLNRSESSVQAHTRETNDTADLFGGDA